MKKKKRVIMTVGIIVVLVMSVLLFKSCFTHAKEGRFQFAAIKRGDVENIVSSTGTLSAVETVEVGSQVSGIIKEVSVDFNDSVEKGQVLAVLDKTLFLVAVNDAEAGVLRAKAKLNQANAELKRNHPLFEKGHLSEMEFLVTKTAAETAEADLKMAEAALKRAKTNLDYTVIRSPINGTVIERTVDPGQTIAASFVAPKLFLIAEDLTRMQIEADVDESDIGQIKEGQSVRFTVQAYPEETFTGNVRQIRLQPETIQNVVNYTVVVDASNKQRLLLPGMTATVDFLVEERRGVLLVPNTALNYKPSMEVLKKYGAKMMEKMKNMASKHGSGRKMGFMGMGGGAGMMSGKLPDNVGHVLYMDKDGNLDFAMFIKGATDGKVTEISRSHELKEGMNVITAYKIEKGSKSSSKRSSIFPPPPGGGRPH